LRRRAKVADPTAVRVAALRLYPVKGCRGLDVPHAVVTATGFAFAGIGDREWMLVDPSGRFVTQRTVPVLALVRIEVDERELVLRVPGCAALRVPLVSAVRAAPFEVEVWGDRVRGFDEGEAASLWLSTWLRTTVRLVRFDRSHPRACDAAYAGDAGAHTMFADGYPVLVVGEASLRDLNDRLRERSSPPLPMNRFRPNLVLGDLPPYAEDHLDTIDVGGVVLRCVKPCTRCQVTATDQDTGQVGLEPLHTLGGYRMHETLTGVTFGINAIVTSGAGGVIAPGATARCEYRF
jgi:uncharacterized protein YcbX